MGVLQSILIYRPKSWTPNRNNLSRLRVELSIVLHIMSRVTLRVRAVLLRIVRPSTSKANRSEQHSEGKAIAVPEIISLIVTPLPFRANRKPLSLRNSLRPCPTAVDYLAVFPTRQSPLFVPSSRSEGGACASGPFVTEALLLQPQVAQKLAILPHSLLSLKTHRLLPIDWRAH